MRRMREMRGMRTPAAEELGKGNARQRKRPGSKDRRRERVSWQPQPQLSVNWGQWHSLTAGGVGITVEIIIIRRFKRSFDKADAFSQSGKQIH